MNHCPVAPERSSQGKTKQRGAWRASEAGKDASPCEVPYALDIALPDALWDPAGVDQWSAPSADVSSSRGGNEGGRRFPVRLIA